jgi:hypothetical protein
MKGTNMSPIVETNRVRALVAAITAAVAFAGCSDNGMEGSANVSVSLDTGMSFA